MRRRLLIGVLVIFIIAAGGLGWFYWEATHPKIIIGEVDFYTSIPKDLAVALVEKFNLRYPNVTLNLIRSGTADLLVKMYAEMEAGAVIADVVWVADPAQAIDLMKKGVLLAYKSPEAGAITFKDPDGYYYAGRIITHVICYNTKMVKNPPTRWTDLIDPSYQVNIPKEWRGQEGWANFPNAVTAGAATVTAYTLARKYGWDYFKKLRANGFGGALSNSEIAAHVAAGEYPVGVTLDYIALGLKAKGSPIDFVYPEDGIFPIPSPVCIMKGTPYPEAAKLFVDFVLSKEGQQLQVQQGVMSARNDMSPPQGLTPLDKLSLIEKDLPSVLRDLAAAFEDVKRKYEEIMLG